MKKHFTNLRIALVGFLVCLMSMSLMAQTPAVTLDFSTNDWNLPTADYVSATNSYTNNDYTITLAGSNGNGYKWNSSNKLILGKSGATLTLPAFDFAVERIEVVGTSGASGSVIQNIFVGEEAVSTATTGAKNVTNVYEIAANYQEAGTVYVLKVLSNHNTQIASIEIYAAESSTPTVEIPTWVTSDKIGVFNTQVTGLVPTFEMTDNNESVFHFAYTDAFQGYPAQTPSTEMGANPSKVYVDVKIMRPNETITGVKVSYGEGHEEIINFTDVEDPYNGTLGNPHYAILHYFPVATVFTDGTVVGNPVEKSWTVDVEWCIGTNVVDTQYVIVKVDAAPGDNWVACEKVAQFNTMVDGLVPTCATVGDSTVYHFSYNDQFTQYPFQTPNQDWGADGNTIYVDVAVSRPNDDITGVKVKYSATNQPVITFGDVLDPNNGTLGAPLNAALRYFPVATVVDGQPVGNTTDKNWTVTYEWYVGTSLVCIQKLNVVVDAAPVIEPEVSWVSCEQVDVFNTQVDGLVPTCATVGDSTVFHFAYTDAFNGFPEQTPNQEMGGNPAKVYVDVMIQRPNDNITGVKVSYGPGHEQIINFTSVTDPNNGTLGNPYNAILYYFPVATVNADGSVTGNEVDRNWTVDVEWCTGENVVAIQKLNVMVDAAPAPVLPYDTVAELPYVNNFDEGVDRYFVIENGENTNKWYTGQVEGFDNNKLYISSNNGTTNKYDITKASNVIAYRDVMIPETGAVLSFDYRVNGQTNTTDYLKVDLNGTEIARLVGENEWTSFRYDISGEMAGVVRVQFNWVNNASAGNQFPAAIDNISVIETSCVQPINLTANVDSTTAVVSWVAAEGQTAWNFEYKLADHSEWYTIAATDTFVSLADLQGNSNYEMRVQAVCGENVSAWTTGTFAVACQSEEIGTAPGDVVIGTGTSTTYMVPFNSLYGYSFTEQIYPSSEVGAEGQIYAVSFYLGQSSTATQTNSIDLYMKNVTRSTFSSTTDYEPVTSGDIVYSGSWTIPANHTGWVTITLDNPFMYDGTSNLMIGMHEKTSGYSTRYFTYTSATNSGISYYSDSYNPDPFNLDSYSGSKFQRSNLANLKLNRDITTVVCADAISCADPSNLEVSDITANSAVLTWTAGAEGQTAFIVEYMAEDATEWTSVNVEDTTYTLTELAQLTNYSVKVKANCGTNNWSEVITTSFRTEGICAPVTNLETSNMSNTTTLTWTAGGEETAWLVQFKPASAGEDAWTSIDVNIIPMTTFGGLQGNTDYMIRVKALCDPQDEENQSEWVSTEFHSGCAAVEVPFVETFTEETENLDCWTKDGFTYNYPDGNAGASTDGAWLITPAINIPSDNTSYLTIKAHGFSGGEYTVLASYRGTREDRFAQIYTGTVTSTTEEVIIPIADLYKGRAVNFKIVNNGDTWKYIDEVTVNECPFVVTSLNTSNVTGTTVDVAWDSHELAKNFQVQYGEAGFTLGEGTIVNVNDTMATTITGLNYETAYDFYVRAACEDETIGWSAPVTATTAPACSDVTNVEYEFLGTGMMLTWQAGEWGTPASYNIRYKSARDDEYTLVNTTALFTTISDMYSNTLYEIGIQAVCSSEYSSEWNTLNVLTPCTNSCDLVFTVSDSYGDGWNGAYVAVYQDNVLIASITCPDLEANETITETVAICKGSDINLVWNTGNDDGECSMVIVHNGVEIYNGGAPASGSFATFAACPNCSAPYALALDTVTSNSAVITWNDNNETGTYTLEYKTAEEEAWTSVTGLTATTYTMTGLVEKTTYMVRVMTVCGYNDESTWTDPISFNTPCANTCDLVFTVVDSYGDGWNGAYIAVYQDNALIASVTCPDLEGGEAYTETVAICKGSEISLVWHSGSYDGECSMVITHAGVEIYNGGAPSGTFATFEACPTCFVPSALAATSEGVVTWESINENATFVVEYKVDGADEWTSATADTITYTIDNLELSTTYWVRVKADCGAGDESDWSNEVSFTTPMCLGGSSATITSTNYTTNWYLPTYSFYNYSLTQQIYLSSEINKPQGGQITSMDFNVVTPKTARNITVYLAHTTESSFTSASFLTLTEAQEVYSGPAFATAGDNLITFDNPFNYNGTDNLVLMVDDNTGSYVSGLQVAQHQATGMAVRIYSDGTNYNPQTPSSYSPTIMNSRNTVTFNFCPPVPDPTCFVPSNLTVSEVSDHSAVVTWADNHNQDNYALEYRADNENGWHVVSVDTTYYLLSNLDASTDYLVRVKAVCDAEDESVYTDVVEFTTVCEHGVEIAFNGTSTSNYVPSHGNYNYGFSQQIYKSSEINAAATISGFEIEVSNTGAKARNIDIYMMHTSATTVTSWLPMDNAQKVYSGTVAFTQGWQQITFDTPFSYNGTDNLVLIVDDNTGSYGNYPTFRTNNGGTNCSRYFYSDGTNFNPFNPTTASTQSSTSTRNNIRFTYCPDPIDLAITDINTFADACEVEGAVTINVKSLGYDGAVSTFEAYYQVNEETPVHETVTLNTPIATNETAEYTFATLPVFATGVNTLTAWVVLEGDVVEANNSITADPITVLDPIAVPYVEEFTGLTINHGWNPIDANNDGITMNLDNNINYTYNDEKAANDWMMSPCIELTAGVYTISYDYKANSAMTESFEVFYGNGAHIADMTNALAAHTFNNTTTETATHTITISENEAGIYNFGFHATSQAGNLGFSIDNFKIYPVNDVVVTYAENGTVTPNGTIAVNYGENLTLNLVPDPMYHVAGVWVDSVQVVPEDGTGASFMLYTLENVTEPHTVFVDFKLEFHIIKSVENYRSDLYADFGGAFVPAATDTTIDPSAFTVNMVADPHYHMAGLTISPMVPDMPEDVFAGVVDNGDGTYSYTIDTLVVANYYLNATFRRDTVAINYNVLTGEGYAHDSQLLVASDTNNNSYTTWVDYSVYNDVDTTVTFHADAPYHVADVIVNGESQGHIAEYRFEDVTEAQNVDIKFGYRIDAFVSNYNTYDSITDIMGTITPDTQYVAEFDPMTVIGTVEEHFHLYQLLVNGENRIDEVVFGDDPHYYSFTIDSVAENYTIEARVKVDTFAITYNVNAGQGYADASGLLVEGDSYSTIVNYGDNWYSNILPATGYSIENVTLDGQNLYTANNYQFNYVVEDHLFNVNFVANTYTVTTNAYGNGTVSDGVTFTYDPDNAVNYEFTATPAEGYYIASVTINNEAMEVADANNFTYTIENVADNYTINVIFQMYTYTMTATVNPSSTLEGNVYGGTITPSGTQTVNYGADVTYTINANEGWYIYYVTIDGETTNYTQADGLNTLDVPFTNINDNHEVEVGFLRYKYDITAAIDGEVHGAINEFFTSLTEVVYYGENFSLTFDADDNYQVADVVIDGEDMGAITSYEFVNVTANHTVAVSFEAIMYTLTATSNIDACAITPATTTVQAGSNVNYTLTVANGYHLENVIANGEEVVVNNNAFTISDVQSDYTIFANFAANFVTVTVDQPDHATITPGTQTYAYGATPTYMIIPAVGYDIVSVTAGDAIVNVTYNNGIGTFTLDPVQADITLTATTAKKQFTITVTQGEHGTIAPATQTVEYGDNVTFTITPNDFYIVSDVLVDGTSRGALSTYTFYNVTGNHSITAVFEGACYMPTNLAAMDITTNSANLTWVGTAPSYEVRYKAADETNYTTQTVSTTSLQLTNLTPGTLYAWGVRAICGTDMTSDWAINAFTTRNEIPDGIADADMSSIKVYSFQNNVYIVNEEGITISNVDIYDIYGKQIYTGKVLSSPEVISLNVANGNYVVRLATDNGVGVYKVAIVR